MRVAVRIALAIGSLIIVPVHAQQADPALQRLNNCVTTPARVPSSQQDIINDIINGMNPAITEPDKVAWCFFLYVNTRAGNSDALFETWASDGETFNPNPQWPATRQPKQFRPNILLQVREAERVLGQGREGGVIQPFVLPSPRPLQPGNNVEVTRRNRPAFDFIINNNLYKITGLQAAFAKFAADRKLLSFPSDAIEVKANWFPVESPGDPNKSGIPGYTGTPNDADRPARAWMASAFRDPTKKLDRRKPVT